MTLPNRVGCSPGQQRDLKSEQSAAPPTAAAAVKMEGMQQELQMMLTSLSAAHGGAAAAQWMPPQQDAKTYVEQSRKRLLEDDTFCANVSYQELLAFANNPVVHTQASTADPFAAEIEKMPTISQTYHGFGASSDGFSSSDVSRSQYMEAVSLQAMGHAAEVVGDPNVRARYEHSGHNLHEWGERRMLQQQQPQPHPSAGRGSNPLPSLSAISLSQVSPYAMELAARNSLPKKRSSLSKLSKQLMHDWFEHNLHHPYPTEEEKEWLAQQGGITLEQVNNWFINTRGRKWKPMLNKLMAEKQAGNCKLYDQMVQKIEEPYHKL